MVCGAHDIIATYSRLPVETGQITGHPDVKNNLIGLNSTRINGLAKLQNGLLNNGVNVNLPNKSVTLLWRGCETIEGMMTSNGMGVHCGKPIAHSAQESQYFGGMYGISMDELEFALESPIWPTDSANLSCQKVTDSLACSVTSGCGWYADRGRCLAGAGSSSGKTFRGQLDFHASWLFFLWKWR